MGKMKKVVSIIIIFTIFVCSSLSFFTKVSYADDEGEETSQTSNDENQAGENTSSNNETTNETGNNENNTSENQTTETTTNEDEKSNTVENEQNQNTNTSSGTTNQTTTKTTTTTTTKTNSTSKSSNANLSDLGIKPNDFKGFKPATTSYSVEVENNVTSVEVYAKTQDSRAKVTGTGTKNLNEGNNALNVIVTAENGTKKTYTINVTRKVSNENKEEEKVEEQQEEKKEETTVNNLMGLSELSIDGIQLSPIFKSDVYEYTAKYTGEDTKLKINAKSSNEGATVEIIGNEELVDGENLINILVTEKDGKIYTYQVTIKKNLVEDNTIENQDNSSNTKIIIICILLILIIAIAIILIIRKMRNNKENEIDNFDEDQNEKFSIKENEEENKTRYVNSILQTSVNSKKEKPVVQDAWFKKEQEQETLQNEQKSNNKEEYGGPIIYEPEDNYDYEELKIEKPVKKKTRSKGKRFK